MDEKENILWTELFQDKPIPKIALENFQAQIMAQIVAHPVDFGAEIRLAARRKWGLGLALSLLLSGLVFGMLLWYGREIVYQDLTSLVAILVRFPYVSELQHGQRLLQSILIVKDLRIGMDLLWGVVSWPLLGVLSTIVVFRTSNPVYDDSSIEKAET